VLKLDPVKQTVHIEPLVTVGQITKELVPQGWMLATTLEIDEATVGGLAMAVGMTTASHKYGLLQETVEEYEVVLGDGELVTASKEKNSDLYYALPWSHGSLGLLVGLTLKVIPVKPYVEVEYAAFNGTEQKVYSDYIRELSLADDTPDFVEATLFTKNQCVVMGGRFVDVTTPQQKACINEVGWWYKPWYYVHVRDMLDKKDQKEKFVEYIPTLQYIFRHNRAIFWTVCDQIPEYIGNNVLVRYLMGWMFPPLVTFLKLPATPKIKHEMMNHRVYQDIVLPIRTIEEATDRADELFGIWPILVYPSLIYDHGPGRRGLFPTPKPQDMVPGKNYAMYYDLGVYGIPKPVREGRPDEYKAVRSMRTMEHYVREVSGAPFLYADTFLTAEEFEEMFNTELYYKVRAQYKAEGNFPTVYQKTTHKLTVEELLTAEEAYTKKTK